MKRNVWIFDIDGVITDPEEKKIIYPQIVTELSKRLKTSPVIFITGRSFPWIKRKVILPLISEIKDKADLKNLFISCEYGGVQVDYDNGNIRKNVGKDLIQDNILSNKIKKIVKDNFSQTMFYDNTKETIFTIEMKKGVNNKKFKKDQKHFHKLLKKLLSESKYSKKYSIIKTTIATDIFRKSLGKDYATRKILSWIKKREEHPFELNIFGDSQGDFVIGEELMKHKLNFTFIFVGEKNNLNQKSLSFPIFFTESTYTKGTLEFLQK